MNKSAKKVKIKKKDSVVEEKPQKPVKQIKKAKPSPATEAKKEVKKG